MFAKVLIANRGAIACRIERTLRTLGVRSVAVYSEADRGSLHVAEADEAVLIGPGPAADSYLSVEKILAAARATGAAAIHPGYGFLSENAEFAEACERAGIAFIGPTPDQMRQFGLKHVARALAADNGLPLLPGSGLLTDLDHARKEAVRIGYPVMLKSTAGGGGIGMQQCASEAELAAAFDSVRQLAGSNFRDSGVFLEKYIARARHIEVQIFGDGQGHVISLGERDCSLQRRNQKVIEETPAPGLRMSMRARLSEAAVRLGKAVGYRSAGTVEFIVDADNQTNEAESFYFLEVNTRLQVEHGVTEAVTGIDLVLWMLETAAGEPLDFARYHHAPKGVSIQARVYAEDPARGFRPASGLLTQVSWPQDVRVDTWIRSGVDVPAFYDPLLAKVIVHAPNRALALEALDAALAASDVCGVETNIAYLREALRLPDFVAKQHTTRSLSALVFQSHTFEVLKGGTHTTVQDWPGRNRSWSVGVPPSGPMDDLAFRIANQLVSNTQDRAGLEMTVSGATFKFGCDAWLALTGAPMRATVDGRAVEYWRAFEVHAGNVLAIGGNDSGAGQRTYLAVRGGIDVPFYLDSRATFTLGQFGGHAGRVLRAGDVLRIGKLPDDRTAFVPAVWPQPMVYGHEWQIDVLYGPHAAPDFFTPRDIEMFFSTAWEVHYQSSRTGVRLIGPKPEWARRDGGEAGLHPSNIHDNPYAGGAIDFTGDMPVILGPDGPSLGGFVCPAVVAISDLWKLGQLRPGDKVRFRPVGLHQAMPKLCEQDAAISQLQPLTATRAAMPLRDLNAVIARRPASGDNPAVCYRQSGEDFILIEYGEPTLDLAMRFRVQALLDALRADPAPWQTNLTPGVRSLQVGFDCRLISQDQVMDRLQHLEESLPLLDDLEVESRIVHLPLAWDDSSTRLAIQRYMQSVRADAPWCPSNIEFIRRINGLDSIDDVRRIVFDASYLVMGLGDVYLGAPVATPLDPRHRLVTTKYNPARTWTPENAVGIGGAYLCVYGMEGPGGYQFLGRTVQMWNRYRQTAEFRDGKQWLLRFFDQLRFFPVDEAELMRMRADFPEGKAGLKIEPARLRLRDYRAFLQTNAASIAAFKDRQQLAFEAERERWRAEPPVEEVFADAPDAGTPALPPGCFAVVSPITGSIWQLKVSVGDRVQAGSILLVLESMKMEIEVPCEASGEVVDIRCQPGHTVTAGQTLVIVRS
jgi:urea carboxylase